MIEAATVVIVCGVPILMLAMLFPAVLELRKPKDSGPRLIVPEWVEVFAPRIVEPAALLNLEEKLDLDVTLKPLLRTILSCLPSLED
jgi:hypothetical protein